MALAALLATAATGITSALVNQGTKQHLGTVLSDLEKDESNKIKNASRYTTHTGSAISSVGSTSPLRSVTLGGVTTSSTSTDTDGPRPVRLRAPVNAQLGATRGPQSDMVQPDRILATERDGVPESYHATTNTTDFRFRSNQGTQVNRGPYKQGITSTFGSIAGSVLGAGIVGASDIASALINAHTNQQYINFNKDVLDRQWAAAEASGYTDPALFKGFAQETALSGRSIRRSAGL